MKEAQGRASHSSDKHCPLYCDKTPTSDPVVTEAFCSAQASWCPTTRERKHNNKREAHQMKKKKHMWHIKWERRGRKHQLRFSYGKCFSYKSSFLTRPPCLLLECSIFKKWLLFRVSSLSVQKGEMGWQTYKVKGTALWQMEFGLILKEQSHFLCGPTK